jgi:biopolymer transport protein ExbD
MNLRPHRREQADINLTPLIDVVFLLLIFFMVSTTFKDETRLRVQLPQAQGEPVGTAETLAIRVSIDRHGAYSVDDAPVGDRTRPALVAALTRAIGSDPARPVLIQADAQTPHQSVMQVLDASRQAGLMRIAFAAVRERQGGAATATDRTPESTPGAARDDSEVTTE